MRNRRLLMIIVVAWALALGSLWFSRQETVVAQLPARSEAELLKLDDAGLIAELSSELARRLYAKGFDPLAWRRLEGPPRQFWVVASLDGELSRVGLVQTLIDSAATSTRPGFADLALAYRELGLPGPAAVAQEVASLVTTHPDFAKDHALYTALQVRLQQQVQAAQAARRLTAYARQHLADFATVGEGL